MKTLYNKLFIAIFLILIVFGEISGKEITEKEGLVSDHQDSLVHDNTKIVYLPYRELSLDRLTGAAQVISAEQLSGKLDLNLLSSLKGLASGLYISENPSENRASGYDISIRGLNSFSISNTAPLIIVDGIQRPIEYLQVKDIESISILKDAVAKSFYRGKSANGIIFIKTKRGSVSKQSKDIQVEYGLSTPKNLPDYLDSYEYVNLYNLARRNSGLNDLYSSEEIEGYKNPNKRYPSNDYYNLLLNDRTNYIRASASFSGGTERLKYYLGAGYLHNGGLEAVGNHNTLNQFNIRTNLDYAVSTHITAFLDVYGFLDDNKSNYLRGNDLFSRMSTQRPNEYAILLKDHYIQDSVAYGASRMGTIDKYQNLYAEMLKGGVRENTKRVGQMSLGFKFDLAPVLEGLSAKFSFSFDSYDYTSIGKNDNFYSYLPTAWDGNEPVSYSLITAGKKNSGMSSLASDGYKQYSIFGQIDYDRTFGDHLVHFGLAVDGDQRENMYSKFKNKTFSNTLLMQYVYGEKWIGELNVGLLGSSKLNKDNRYGFFPAVGMGWIVSKEDFMADLPAIGYLKLKASYGISGSDDSFDYLSYQTRWSYYDNSIFFGSDAKNEVNVTRIESFLSENLDWEKSKELNVGLEMIFLNDFYFDMNYYHIRRTNIPVLGENVFSQIWGISKLKLSHAQVKNNGFDFSLGYKKNIGDWKISANANFNYSLSKYMKTATWENMPEGRDLKGKAVDSYVGLISDGLIRNIADLSGLAPHSFGNITVGDLKYQDLNNDTKIDQNDVREIGNSFPRIQYGLHLAVNYKNIGLAISGYGVGAYDLYLNTSYYRPMPETAYSIIAKEAFNPETGAGSYPRLSMDNSSNNYQLSDFWLIDGSYFKIKDIELSYIIPAKISKKIMLDKVKLFARGNNLMTFSGLDDLDPECIQAGVTRYPFMRTFTAGFNLSF